MTDRCQPDVNQDREVAKTYIPTLDPNCLLCRKPLSDRELEYWNSKVKLAIDTKPSVLKTQCISCLKSLNRIIPEGLRG